jgi:hypothetical protein
LSHLDLSAGARRSTSISRFAQVFFTQSVLGPVGYRTAVSGAKRPSTALFPINVTAASVICYSGWMPSS